MYSEEQTDLNGNKWALCLCHNSGEQIESGDDNNTHDGVTYSENASTVGLGDRGVAEENDDGVEDNEVVEDNEGYTSIFVKSITLSESDTYKADLRILDRNGNMACEKSCQYGSIRKGDCHFLKWSYFEEKDILKDGTLCIDVTIQVIDTTEQLLRIPNHHAERLYMLLESGEKSDASFNVGGTRFNVHSQIIYANAPMLFDFLDQESNASAVIKDIRPDVFRAILKHIYCGALPRMNRDHPMYMREEVLFDCGKDLISAANRFELIEMKLAVENVLVGNRILNKENVSDYILFADAQTCPLLKEYAISYFLLHSREILESEHSKCLRESGTLLSEIFMLQNGSPDQDLSVTELRRNLRRYRLDVDGSKEMLVEKLNNAKRQRTD